MSAQSGGPTPATIATAASAGAVVAGPAGTAVDAAVAAQLAAMPLERLAHFTPARNLPNIIADGYLRSVADMDSDVRACYSPTDRERLDGYPDKVCCSLQYPNGFYFAKARTKQDAVNYPDWVCLLMDKMTAATQGTLFTPRNAAASSHKPTAGAQALLSCYAPSVTGSWGVTRSRGAQHDPRSPTDVQAEVLVTAPIPLSAVRAIVVPTAESAREEHARLLQLGLVPPAAIRWVVCAGMFNKDSITNAVFSSRHLSETPWVPDSTVDP
jgi:hypothetical protein